MTEIILTNDQTRQLAAAIDGVVIADAAGNVVASIPPSISKEEEVILVEAKRRLAQPFTGRCVDIKVCVSKKLIWTQKGESVMT